MYIYLPTSTWCFSCGITKVTWEASVTLDSSCVKGTVNTESIFHVTNGSIIRWDGIPMTETSKTDPWSLKCSMIFRYLSLCDFYLVTYQRIVIVSAQFTVSPISSQWTSSAGLITINVKLTSRVSHASALTWATGNIPTRISIEACHA